MITRNQRKKEHTCGLEKSCITLKDNTKGVIQGRKKMEHDKVQSKSRARMGLTIIRLKTFRKGTTVGIINC